MFGDLILGYHLKHICCVNKNAWGCLPRGGVCLGGVCTGGVCLPWGMSTMWVVCHRGVHLPPWTEFLIHASENITSPQLCLLTVTNKSVWTTCSSSTVKKSKLKQCKLVRTLCKTKDNLRSIGNDVSGASWGKESILNVYHHDKWSGNLSW